MQLRKLIQQGYRIVSPLMVMHAPIVTLAMLFIMLGYVASMEPILYSLSFLFVIGVMLVSTAAGLLAFSDLILQSARDLRRLQLPDSTAHVIGAHLIVIVGMLLIPSVLMITLAGSWTLAMLLFCVGLLALNIPLVLFSRPWIIGLNKCTVLFVIPMVIFSMYGIYSAAQNPEQTVWCLLPLMILLVGTWLWHWRVELTTPTSRYNQLRNSDGSLFERRRNKTIENSNCTIDQNHSAADVVRMFLGKPYILDSLQEKILYISTLFMIILLTPLFLFIGYREFTSNGVWYAWHFTYSFSLYLAAITAWIYHMRTTATRFESTGLAIHELALLPNMGNRRQQLRGLIAGIFFRPSLIVSTISFVAAVTTYYYYHDWILVLNVLVVGILITALGGSGYMLGAIVGKRHMNNQEQRKTQLNQALWQPLIQTFVWTLILPVKANNRNLTGDITFYIFCWFELGTAFIMPLPGIVAVYKLSRRPHPFVEITE